MIRKLQWSQLALDLVIAFVFLLLIQPTVFSSIATEILAIASAVVLALRRLSPWLALGIAWVLAIVQMASGHGPAAYDLAILVALFAAGNDNDRRLRRLGLSSALFGALVAAVFVSLTDSSFGAIVGRLRLSGAALYTAQLIFDLGFFVAFLGLSWVLGLLSRTTRLSRESKLAQQVAEVQRRQAEREVAVEQERNRIARDMHDVVAHSLAVVIAQADGARYARASDPDAVDEALTTISSTSREALSEVRGLLGQLRHNQDAGPQPMLADLDRLLEQMRSSGLAVDHAESGKPVPLGVAQQLAVYRIVQEALTNALRHGSTGTPVELRLEWGSSLEVSVRNRARNLPAARPAAKENGHGIAGMTERAALAGGTLRAEPDGPEFRVTATFPLPSSPTKKVDRS